MIYLPRKMFCAIEAVLYIAYNAAQGPVSSREIAEEQQLPPRYLEQLMQRLVRAGILRGVRGPRGGYVLARERRRITVADIYTVAQEESAKEDAHPATPLGKAAVEPVWHEIQAQALAKMQEITLADLCDRARAEQVSFSHRSDTDFSI